MGILALLGGAAICGGLSYAIVDEKRKKGR